MQSSRIPYTDFMYLEKGKLVDLILIPLSDKGETVPCKNCQRDHRVK